MSDTPRASDEALSFRSLTKTYRLYDAPRDRLVEALTGRKRHSEVHALAGVSGSVARGTAVGLIGENGSGKSTLLKILAGTTEPTSGSVSRSGRITSILELGSSFHPEVTGRRNVVLQAALTGLSRPEVEAALPEIEAFAELGEFLDRPVKTYSSGMSMRLAFAVATAVLPDVVILDEALAVGDGHFQKKCVDRIFDLKSRGRTILFCSHAMYYVTTLCDRAIWLRAGQVAAEGPAPDVVLAYERHMAACEELPAAASAPPAAARTPGRFLDVRLVGADGRPRTAFRPGEPFTVELEFAADDPDRPFHVHVGVATRDQVNCFAADSNVDRVGPFRGRRRYALSVTLPSLPLAKGEFVVHAFLVDEKALAVYDTNTLLSFRVDTEEWKTGLFRAPFVWTDRSEAAAAGGPQAAGETR